MDNSRRKFLVMTALAPLAAVPASRLVAQDPACYDPATLPLSQRNQRKALEFVEHSTDAARRCGLCAFYRPGAGGCGKCALLSEGPVTEHGVCAAYAAKQG